MLLGFGGERGTGEQDNAMAGHGDEDEGGGGGVDGEGGSLVT